MNVASLENCKELYELSGWKYRSLIWIDNATKAHAQKGYPKVSKHQPPIKPYEFGKQYGIYRFFPAYDLGYLMRKLPALIDRSRFLSLSHVDVANDGGGWVAGYTTNIDDVVKGKVTFKYDTVADTHEDAACKLCIELFRQGVLKHD